MDLGSLRRLVPPRPAPLPAVPTVALVYIGAVSVSYLASIAAGALLLDFSRPQHLWLVPLLGFLLLLNQLSAPMRASRASSMNWRFDTTFIVLCALLLPTGWGLVTLWVGVGLGEVLLRAGRARTLFNVAQLGVANSAAFLVMAALHLEPTATLGHVGTAVLGAAVSYLVSSLLVIVVIALAQGARPRFEVLAVFHFAWLAAVSIGLLIALPTLDHVWALPFALAGALAVYYALEPRLASRWEKEDAQALFELASRVSRADDIGEIESAVLETTGRLLAAPARLDEEAPGEEEIGAPLDDGCLVVAPRPGRRPYDDEDRETLKLLATLLDTARRNVQARAQASEEERGRLLAAVAHEMRTPLTSVLGFTRTILSGRIPDPKPALEQIASAGEQMERLINDLLVLQQAREERFSVEREPVALVDLVEEQLERYRGQSERHELTLTAAEPLIVLADRQRLGQVVANLISNAIKYSPEGGLVELSLRKAGEERARLEVRDHGLGVPAAAREHLFRRFFRLGGEHGAIRGSGLGLAIVAELVQAHGGQVGYQEPSGPGSIFYVELPLA